MKNLLRFVTILFEVITLCALMTHLLELRGKISMSQQNYFVVQGIYSGWAWLGIFEIGAILLTFIWTIAERKNNKIFSLLLFALIIFVVSLTLFFMFTFPSNTATANWTEVTSNWKILRERWEYSHAVRAILNLVGFCLLILAVLKNKKYYR